MGYRGEGVGGRVKGGWEGSAWNVLGGEGEGLQIKKRKILSQNHRKFRLNFSRNTNTTVL